MDHPCGNCGIVNPSVRKHPRGQTPDRYLALGKVIALAFIACIATAAP